MLSYAPGDELMTSKHEEVQGLYEWGLWESGDFMQTGGRVRQRYDSRSGRWGQITLDYEKYIEEM
eukprot:7424331-Alexandrium_andersonii.AAC.1